MHTHQKSTELPELLRNSAWLKGALWKEQEKEYPMRMYALNHVVERCFTAKKRERRNEAQRVSSIASSKLSSPFAKTIKPLLSISIGRNTMERHLYYHVYVWDNEGQWYETDFDRDTLMSEIVEPYLSGVDFHCGGHRTNLKRIKKLKIGETDQDSSHYTGEMERRGRGVAIDKRYYLVFEIGRDVTRQFVALKKLTKRERREKFSNRIFIVHGHDELPKEQLARTLTKMGFEPIILHEQPNQGRTLIEKFEEECEDIGFAFVIITPDDVGMDRELYEKMMVGKYKNGLCFRARQNVIFELGFFYGKLGRNRVCCLYKGDVEILSDISGVLYIEFKEKIEEKYADIIRELRAAGYEPKV